MKTLDNLADFIEKKANNIDNIVAKIQDKVAEKIRNDVVENAPYKTGMYVDSIKVYPTEIKNNTITTFIGTNLWVGPTLSEGKSYNLGYLLEHGTLPHDIYPYDTNSLKFEIDGKVVFAKHVWHPGTIAQPHFRLALEKNKKFYKDNIKLVWRQ